MSEVKKARHELEKIDRTLYEMSVKRAPQVYEAVRLASKRTTESRREYLEECFEAAQDLRLDSYPVANAMKARLERSWTFGISAEGRFGLFIFKWKATRPSISKSPQTKRLSLSVSVLGPLSRFESNEQASVEKENLEEQVNKVLSGALEKLASQTHERAIKLSVPRADTRCMSSASSAYESHQQLMQLQARQRTLQEAAAVLEDDLRSLIYARKEDKQRRFFLMLAEAVRDLEIQADTIAAMWSNNPRYRSPYRGYSVIPCGIFQVQIVPSKTRSGTKLSVKVSLLGTDRYGGKASEKYEAGEEEATVGALIIKAVRNIEAKIKSKEVI